VSTFRLFIFSAVCARTTRTNGVRLGKRAALRTKRLKIEDFVTTKTRRHEGENSNNPVADRDVFFVTFVPWWFNQSAFCLDSAWGDGRGFA
jgi:hypothetical protein